MTANRQQRKIILDLAVTLDGFIEGPNGEVDWCIMDPEMNFTDFLHQIDTILYGRKSYELWGEYIPKSYIDAADGEMWGLIHSKQKYVFSKHENHTNFQAIYINENIFEEMKRLKYSPGKDIWLYGGSSIITTFLNLGLIDEFRLSIHPVILGNGKPIFTNINQRIQLQLTHTKTFSSGVVQQIYQLKK